MIIGMETRVIAEVGSNHGGKFDQAVELIKKASWTGAYGVKFQFFRAASLAHPSYGGFQTLQKFETPFTWASDLMDVARDNKIEFISTPFDSASAEFLARAGQRTFKIASGDVTHHDLLRTVADVADEIIISVGSAYINEIKHALEILTNRRSEDVITVLHCTPLYPCPLEHVNLARMSFLQEHLKHRIGLSDHTTSIQVPSWAVALGATMIEKHFRLEELPYASHGSPDLGHSLNPHQFALMIDLIKDFETARHDAEGNTHNRSLIRRGLYYRRDLKKGESPQSGDVEALRPLHPGQMPPDHAWDFTKLTKDVLAGDPVYVEDFA